MRTTVVACLIALCGCGGTVPGGAAPAPAAQSVGVVGPAGNSSLSVVGSNNSNVQSLNYPVDQVWRTLPAVFDSLGVPVNKMDPATHTIGNEAYAIRRRLKNVPLSRYIDCGSSQLGPSADDYDVRLSVLVEVHGSAGTSTMTTTVSAVARPVNYAQDYSACTSRGGLESKIVQLVNARLAK